MKVRSTKAVIASMDREGIEYGFIEISIRQRLKDDVTKSYIIETNDNVVVLDEFNTEIKRYPIPQKKTGTNEKVYKYSYAEFEAQREYLSSIFPAPVELVTQSEKEDYYLQMGLLLNLMNIPIYEMTCNIEFDTNGVYTGTITGDWELI